MDFDGLDLRSNLGLEFVRLILIEINVQQQVPEPHGLLRIQLARLQCCLLSLVKVPLQPVRAAQYDPGVSGPRFDVGRALRLLERPSPHRRVRCRWKPDRSTDPIAAGSA